jgi:hypothetical protein
MNPAFRLSIAIPLHNEETVLPEFLRRTLAALDQIAFDRGQSLEESSRSIGVRGPRRAASTANDAARPFRPWHGFEFR